MSLTTPNVPYVKMYLFGIQIQGSRVRSRSGPILSWRLKIDHEIISTVILLPSADLFKKGCCQLQAKVCARITG